MEQTRIAVAAITIDFGNTLVRVDRPGLRDVVEVTGDALVGAGIVPDRGAFLRAWTEERERQFREEVPHFREVDIGQRAVRVFARLRGMPGPPAEVPWDLVFLDPPYEVRAIVAPLRAVEPHLAPDAMVMVKHFWRTEVPELPGLRSVRQRRFGETMLSFLEAQSR